MGGQVDIQLRRSGTIYVVDVKGEMDLYNASRLKDVIKTLIDRNVRQYIINLEALDYCDSSGIGAILYIFSELRKRGMLMVVSGPRGSVKRVIELTKLVGYLPLAADLNEALARLRERAPAAGAADHPAERPADRPAERAADRPADRASDRTADRPAEPAAPERNPSTGKGPAHGNQPGSSQRGPG